MQQYVVNQYFQALRDFINSVIYGFLWLQPKQTKAIMWWLLWSH